MKTKILCILLIVALLLSLAGCASGKPASSQSGGTDAASSQKTQEKRVDLMKTVKPAKKEAEPITPEAAAAASDFALRLFRAANDPDQNTLISPLSVLCALAMTANGAEDETLLQMESTLGMRRDLYNEFFNSYLSAMRSVYPNALRLANSIWFTDRNGFEPKEDFLAVNAACYGADAYLAPFDGSTVQEINAWVKKNTDGMIPAILDEIPDEAVMYLVNALAFEGKWEQAYEKSDVSSGEFTAADGTIQTVDFMYSEEQTYLRGGKAEGFIKYYRGGKYAFVALLPDEGVGVGEYLASLDGESLQSLLENRSYETVRTVTPKFETQTGLELSDVLKAMGMELPFISDRANFRSLGTSTVGNVFISRVLHKTYISVDESGTRAGAATAVEAAAECADEDEPKYVRLDRPFIYMLIDCENNLPFFIGTMMKPGE